LGIGAENNPSLAAKFIAGLQNVSQLPLLAEIEQLSNLVDAIQEDIISCIAIRWAMISCHLKSP
jgi:hypothetical protein